MRLETGAELDAWIARIEAAPEILAAERLPGSRPSVLIELDLAREATDLEDPARSDGGAQ